MAWFQQRHKCRINRVGLLSNYHIAVAFNEKCINFHLCQTDNHHYSFRATMNETFTSYWCESTTLLLALDAHIHKSTDYKCYKIKKPRHTQTHTHARTFQFHQDKISGNWNYLWIQGNWFHIEISSSAFLTRYHY